jgi:hypothetical protein
MPAYDGSCHDPPAPVASVSLRAPESGALVAGIALLIDSGADVTLVPREAVQRIGLSPLVGQGCELIGFDGSRSVAAVVSLDLLFLG